MKSRRFPSKTTALCVRLTFLCAVFSFPLEGRSGGGRPVRTGTFAGIEFRSIVPDPTYSDSVEPDSLRYACADAESDLRALFLARGLPFESRLVHKQEGSTCHIFFEPTVPGFRADADNFRISGVYADIEALNFLVRRSDHSGYTLDIIKSFLSRVQRPLRVSIGMAKIADDELYQQALRFHFPDTIHEIVLREIAATEGNPWVQDYLKAGKSAGERVVLVTRDLYEGNRENGMRFRPLLDGMKTRPFVRSKLSWEGGDLQFLQHPQDSSQLVLFYGNTAGLYWGKVLTDREFEYVLKVEFGADAAIDLSDLTPHVDYFISFLPADRVALVSTPVSGDIEIARDALRVLKEKFAQFPPPEILAIEKILHAEKPKTGELRKALRRARKEQATWAFPVRADFVRALHGYVQTACRGQVDECVEDGRLSLERQRQLLRDDPEFLGNWVAAAMTGWSTQAFISSYLAIIETQFRDIPSARRKRVEEKIRELEALGLRVIRVPRIAVEEGLEVPWSGVSYVNNLLIDNVLFIPTFGLTSLEGRLIKNLEQELGGSYEIVPIFSQHMIVHNGAIHCTVAPVRD